MYETSTGHRGAYVQQVIVTCREAVDVDRLRDAWLALVRRHDALRTSFTIGDGRFPSLCVHDEVSPGIVVNDWRAIHPRDRETRWRELLAAERETGFDPNHPPLMRVAICRLEDGLTRLLWSYHHAILDGRSRLMLLREVFELYGASADSELAAGIPPPPFTRFAQWAVDRAADPATQAFWREQMRGVDRATPAPGVNGCAPTGLHGAGLLTRRLDPELSRALREMTANRKLTIATALQGIYALQLSQEADCDDLLYATTRAGRSSVPFDTRKMIGLLMVTSPVRLRLPRAVTVARWLETVRDFGLAARPFEHVPLSDLLSWSDIPRPQPIAETLFSYENATMNTQLRAQDPAWQRRDVQLLEQLGYPLTLEAAGDEEILVRVIHDRSRVPEAEAQRILTRFETLVRAAVADPDAPADRVLGLSPGRRRALSGALVPAPLGDPVPHQIREQAARAPDRIAVEHRAARVTYGSLDQRAEAIAVALAQRGVTSGTLVAVAMGRTPDMIATLLAVHRVGGAYVPVDPRLPRARIDYLLRDSAAALLVTDQAGAPVLAGPGGEDPLIVDRLPRHATAGDGPSRRAIDPHHASHVIYTSGSTGRPKGVVVEHRGVTQLAEWARATFSDAQRDGVLASTSLSFDLSVFEILVTLALGGRVVLVDDVLELGDPAFSQRVAFVNSVPSAIGALLGQAALPGSVRTVALAGEPLSRQLVDRLLGEPSIDAVWNLYGPTEDTTYSSAHRCIAGRRPLIGRPLPGTFAHVVDRNGGAVPEGVAGELLLGGDGLARGYLNRERLTAERFVDVSVDRQAPQRMYRTGDRVRWTTGGELDFLGRLDDQVKIRGVRVEPGELAHALEGLDGVLQAAVLAGGESGAPKLTAYVVGRDLQPDRLHAALREQLPAPLLPAAIVVLASLPLTPNGKLDRRALPAPDDPVAATAGPASTPVLRALGALWMEVLGLSALPGPVDDFFQLGGDSLTALHLLTAIEERFDRRLPVRALLEATTLQAQGAAIEAARSEPMAGALVALRASGERPPFICVFTDQRGIIALRNVLPATLTDQPVFAIQAIDPAHASWRSSSIESIAAACVRTLAEHSPGPYRLGGHSLGGLVAFEMSHQLLAVGKQVPLLVLFDTLAPQAFRWPGRITGRHRVLRGRPWLIQARGQANLVRSSALQAVALARGERLIKPWPRGFDDPWDQAGAHRIMRRYRPAPLPVAITVMSTELSVLRAGDDALGWRQHASGPVAVRRLPGEHMTLFARSEVQVLAAALAQELAAAELRDPHADR